MNILVTGATGLIGSALVPTLTAAGHRVTRMGRSPSVGEQVLRWDPATGLLDPLDGESYDAVVHLAGESIGEGRWNAAKKQRIKQSRVKGTKVLCEALARAPRWPRVMVCASAVGWYGDRGEEVLHEGSLPGSDFLADVCREWEAASEPLKQKGVRIVQVRSGMVLSARGGGLAKMLLPFKLGVGGIIGSGRQYWSWIDIEDEVGVILHALQDESLEGPVNAVAPQAVTNAEFTNTLGRVLRRPTVFPMPAFAARLVLGEVADALLLASQRVEPRRLLDRRFGFKYPGLEASLRHVLGA